jgi:hypothetical protein
MATTEQLLKMTTRGAVVRMVNDENQTGFDGSVAGPLTISPPLSIGGLRTEVELSIRRQVSDDDALPFPGQLAFRYNRLDVEGTLGGRLDGFRPPMPTSTQVLLDELTHRTGIKFETADFVLEGIGRSNAAPYVLKAKVESFRWVGSMELTLLDLTDLTTYIPGGLTGGTPQLQFITPSFRTRDNQPYLNATVHRRFLDNVIVDDLILDTNHPLFDFISRTVGTLGVFLRDQPSPWNVNPTESAYNLRGARLINKSETIENLNGLVPEARSVARVRLGSLDTIYGDKDLLIPYAIPDFADSEFTNAPRLKVAAVVNGSNGTLWNQFLNTLTAPSIITTLPSDLNLRFSGPDEWVANADNPSPTNLFNAVVQYNGAKRAYDMQGYHPECNRVLVLTVSGHNTAYRGNLLFHYRAPIIIDDVLPDAIFGSSYDHDLAPSEGTAPYSMTLVSGALATTHSLTSGFHIVGATNATGNFFVVYDVEDAEGVVVRYALRYRAIIGPIVAEGVPDPAVRSVPYDFTFEVSGGFPDYTYQLLNNGGGELTLPDPSVPEVIGNFSGLAGLRFYTLEITDSQGNVAVTNFNIDVS